MRTEGRWAVPILPRLINEWWAMPILPRLIDEWWAMPTLRRLVLRKLFETPQGSTAGTDEKRTRVQRVQRSEKKWGRHHPKPDVVVPEVRVIVVTKGTPHEVVGEEERAATQHPGFVLRCS